MVGGDRVEDEVETLGVLCKRRRVLCDQDVICAEPAGVGFLGRRSGQYDNARAHRVSQFDAHMAKTAEPRDTNFLARTNLPVPQR